MAPLILEPTDDWDGQLTLMSSPPTWAQVGIQGTSSQEHLPSSHFIYPVLHDIFYHFTWYLEDAGVAGKYHDHVRF